MRNFAKDREICNAATPGPWYDHNPDDDHYMNAYAVTTSPDEPCVDRFNNDHKEIVAITLLQSPRVVCHEDDRWAENARFIAKARTGWPAALDRIAELEAENARLKEQLERWNAAKSSMNTTLSLPPTTGANSSL